MSRKLHFLHGSSLTTEKPEQFAFSLFDYRFNLVTEKAEHEFVNSGRDSHGPGIYAFGVEGDAAFSASQIHDAKAYSGKNGKGSVIGFSVEIFADDDEGDVLLANECDAEVVSKEEWVAVVEEMVVQIRNLSNYSEDDIEYAIQEVIERCEAGEFMTDSDVENVFSECLPELDLSYMSPGDFEDIDALESSFREHLEQYDPANFILQTGGAEYLADMALREPNLWESVKYLHGEIACENTGNSIDTYNALFLRSVRTHVEDMGPLQVAEVDGFYVVFDTTHAEINMMKQSVSHVDEAKFDALCQAVIECGETYWSALEKEQLMGKMNDVAQTHFGQPFSEKTLRHLVLVRSPDSMYSGLQKMMRDDMAGAPQMDVVWEREPGMEARYLTPEAPKQDRDAEPAISNVISMKR
ncbi:MAG: hypothetical protein GY774_23630 [Planctomycetes bacterium]|nr:hypothetical protein [Planctomycetota bacterium]